MSQRHSGNVAGLIAGEVVQQGGQLINANLDAALRSTQRGHDYPYDQAETHCGVIARPQVGTANHGDRA